MVRLSSPRASRPPPCGRFAFTTTIRPTAPGAAPSGQFWYSVAHLRTRVPARGVCGRTHFIPDPDSQVSPAAPRERMSLVGCGGNRACGFRGWGSGLLGCRPACRAGPHRRSHRWSGARRGQHAGGAGDCPRRQHLQRRALADDDQCSRPVFHRVSVGRRAIPDRGPGSRIRSGTAGLHSPRARPAPDHRFRADAGRGAAAGDHRHRHGRSSLQRRPHRPRPDHLGYHHRSASGRRPRLHRARAALPPGDRESQRRTLLLRPARPVQQHPDRRHQQQRSLRQCLLRQRHPGLGRGAHRVYPRGGERAPGRRRAVRCSLRQLRRRPGQCRHPLGLEPRRGLDPRLPGRHRHLRDRLVRQSGGGFQPEGIRPDPRRAHRAGSRRLLPQRRRPTGGHSASDTRSNQRLPPAERIRPEEASATKAWCVSRTSCGATGSSREPSRPARFAYPPETSSPR